MQIKIIPFSIVVGPYTSGDAYPLRATFGAAEVVGELRLPEDLLDATADLLERGELELNDPASFGRMLGQALLAPALRELLLRSVKEAAQAGARLQLQLQIIPPELAMLPWELITLGMARPWSPALHDDYSLVRVIRSAQPLPPAAVVGPLQVLAVGAPGQERQLDMLTRALHRQLRAGLIALHVLRDATPATLERALHASPVHILHLAAPVAMAERGAPRLMLRRGLDMFDLIELLAGAADLRLITLAGAQGDGDTVGVLLPRLASLLANALPATIAFGGPLPATGAARFAAACYTDLANGIPVDLAVTAGRRALAEHAGAHSWGLPQLRLAPGGAQLFAFAQARPPTRVGAKLLALIGAAAVLLLVVFLGVRMLNERAAESLLMPAIATVSTPTPPLPTPALASPAPVPDPGSYATYLTAADDTLEQIAERMGSDPGAIASLNRLDPRAPLRAGYPLVIPVYQTGEAGTNGLIINRGNPATAKVALTFDIEIDQQTLYSILDILRARGLHGTFFLTGRWVMAYPEAAKAIIREGHEIGNHSLTHPYFSRIGLDGAASELAQTEKIIQQTIDVTSRPFFRFPYGDSTPAVSAVIGRAGYVAYHWSADDGTIANWLIWAAQHKDAANGGILLMHGRPSTVESLPGWLDQLAAIGMQATTLGDTLR